MNLELMLRGEGMVALAVAIADILAIVAASLVWLLNWAAHRRNGGTDGPWSLTTGTVSIALAVLLVFLTASLVLVRMFDGGTVLESAACMLAAIGFAVALIVNRGPAREENGPWWSRPANSIELLFLVAGADVVILALLLADGLKAAL